MTTLRRYGAISLLSALLILPTTAHAAAWWWCGLSDPVSGIGYVSETQSRSEMPSRSQLRQYASRFRRVINASHGTSIAIDDNACRGSASIAIARSGRMRLQNRFAGLGYRLVTIGVF